MLLVRVQYIAYHTLVMRSCCSYLLLFILEQIPLFFPTVVALL